MDLQSTKSTILARAYSTFTALDISTGIPAIQSDAVLCSIGASRRFIF